MNVVRYLLSLYVLYSHSGELGQLKLPFTGHTTMAVGGFFALSGFLLFASFQKKPEVRHYISRRARRILPPYFFIVIFAAILLCLLSSYTVWQYFTSDTFWKYLASNLAFLNFLQPSLPGVFDGDNFAMAAVNGSLWTMKGEWVCYLSIPLICYFMSLIKKKCNIILVVILIVLSAAAQYILIDMQGASGNEIYGILAKQFGTMLTFFLFGALLNYLYPFFLKHHKWFIFGAISIFLLNVRLPLFGIFFLPLATSVSVIWLSMIGTWGINISKSDNISYDIYLFHFPIIQVLVYFGINKTFPTFAFVATVVTTTVVLSLLSWNLIGKRFLKK